MTGDGRILTDMVKAKAVAFTPQALPAGLMKKLIYLVYTPYCEKKITILPEDIAE
ncbi:hypothetical protein [Bartonella harrusi]|uniref:Uncharacterized protein n=1 Tax=Bartonella harrusi TaxID=2961895 RepID=A0ABY5ETD1_9HYPH|nr:hypothetical protein [Bartonella harrusi]UTO28527.1 hypothetical protein NMK50_00330 [Bartonella harrusi]